MASATLGDVIARMRALRDDLPRGDGVGCFNLVYLRTTEKVAEAIAAGRFADPAALTRLDRVFADYYFAACDASDESRSKAWAPLFEGRADPGPAALQFALAGMNAHINHDLALALLEVWREQGSAPDRRSAQYRDFCAVNQVLGATEPLLKGALSTGTIDLVDRALGEVDDLIALWSIGNAREAAWTHAEQLHRLEGLPAEAQAYREALGRVVGMTSRLLLLPRGAALA